MPGVRHSKREGRPVSPAATEFESATRRAIFYAKFTIGYNVIEGIVAVSAGAVAGAVSLIGFGVDSVIEVAAATVVLVRLLATARGGEPDEVKERRALKFIAVTFFVLAAYVVFEGARDLITGEEPNTSIVGIAITGLSIIIMPWLARAKRRGRGTDGLGLAWIDAVAGFVIAVFAIIEGKEAWEGELVCDDDDD